MKKIIALVVTYKRELLLKQVLNSLLGQTYPVDKIIVIDNNSGDGTKTLVESFRNDQVHTPHIEYHNTGGNLGGAGGFAYGFKLLDNIDYDHLWLMDDDLCPDKHCLANLLSAPSDGIVQPLRMNLDGTCAELSPVEYNLKNPFLVNPKIKSVKDIDGILNLSTPFDIAGIPFEGPLISKAVVDSIGIPLSNFFIFNDDLDYSIRARNAGFHILLQPTALAHRMLTNNQQNDLRSWKGFFMLRNHFYILKTHGENIFVRIKPWVIGIGYCAFSLAKGDLALTKICFNALKHFRKLTGNELFKP